MKKQLKNTIRAYLCAIMLVVYIIGVVIIARDINNTRLCELVIIIDMGMIAINLFLLE